MRRKVHETKQRQEREALAIVEDYAEVKRKHHGAFEQDVRARHSAVKLAKAPVKAQPPAVDEGDDMEEDDN